MLRDSPEVMSATNSDPKFQNPFSHDISPKQSELKMDPSATGNVRWDTRPEMARQLSIADRKPLKMFDFRKRLFRSDMSIWRIEDGIETQEYFASCTDWRWNVPDVTLYSGTDTTGPVLGVARFRWSRHITFGIGDPKGDPSAVMWEKMQNPSFWNRSNYEFEWSDFDVNAPQVSRRRRFKWHRTGDASDGVEGVVQKLAMRSYKLTDDDSGEVVALFLACSTGGSRGKLRIFQQLNPHLETVILLTCASIQEYAHRE